MLYTRNLLPVVLLVLMEVCILLIAAENNTLASRRKYLEEQAFNTYRAACMRLQFLANWLSVLFKLMSAWTNYTTKHMIVSKDLNIDKGARSIPMLPERPGIVTNGSQCSSLKNLHVTLQTYVHFQAQLLQLKAVLGSLLLKTGKTKLNDTSSLLQGKLGNLDFLSITSLEIFDKLKQSSQFLTTQNAAGNSKLLSAIKDIQKSQNFRALFQQQKNISDPATDESSDSKQAQVLLKTGDFFQNLGRAIDRIFK